VAIYQISQRHTAPDLPIDHAVLTSSVIIHAETTYTTFQIFMKNKSAAKP
jgi:hypothetical protein